MRRLALLKQWLFVFALAFASVGMVYVARAESGPFSPTTTPAPPVGTNDPSNDPESNHEDPCLAISNEPAL
ncbi:MAG: hypothetical protein C4320_05380 [Armatimonadota bacterium]